MVRLSIFCIALVTLLSSFKEDPSLLYIHHYKEIAISEMHRTGIPASVKMAQALLESGAGRSSLANDANNHFGIKCGGSWNGETYFLHDDDYNSRGQLIKSCFRQFESAMESFIAHSDFLRKQNRYAFLFNIDSRDYKSWAQGLKKAGYATDQKYSDKLINIIEKYQLYLLDEEMLYETEGMLAHAGDHPQGHAREHRSNSGDGLFTYPGAVNSTDEKGESKWKKEQNTKRVDKEANYHIVGFEESIADIARMYDLEENAIRLRNRIPKDGEVYPGEKLHLRNKFRLGNRPEYSRDNDSKDIAANDTFIF